MPSKIQLDENLWFLYICLQKSDLKTIDFNAVGHATSLKPPAARMRYTRLRRQMESGTLIGTHGTPFASPQEPVKRKRSSAKSEPKGLKVSEEQAKEEEEDRDAEGEVDTDFVDGNVVVGRGEEDTVEKVEEVKIKQEDESDDGRRRGDGEGESDGTDEWESEDEMPLAKLRKTQAHMHVHASHTGTGTVIPNFHPIMRQQNPGVLARGEREGAPVPESSPSLQQQQQQQQQEQTQLNPYPSPLLHSQPSPHQGHNNYTLQNQQQDYTHGRTFSSQPQTYNSPPPEYIHDMQRLPGFSENFGPYRSPYQGEWRQFEDTRVPPPPLFHGMGSQPGVNGWAPRKTV